MKILLLADAGSSHTIKWACSLSRKGINIAVFSLSNCNELVYSEYPNIKLYFHAFSNELVRQTDGAFSKLQYLKVLNKLKRVIEEYQPDIIHAHYASSYGLLGALSGFHSYIISVWGSDVFDFPNKSIFHKLLLRYNLSHADRILSTSHVMAKETSLYTSKHIEVTPFGIDINIFKAKKVDSLFLPQDIVIGTIKTLEEKYGIEHLIKAFAIVKKKHRALPLKLLIVGGGSQEAYLKNLASELDVSNDAIFTGKVPYDDVVKYHNMLSISVSVSVSNSESFGVAIIEASSCEKPVVVSNVGGLPEVVENGVTGFIVEPRNSEQTAEAIEELILNEDLRIKMGQAGRARVEKLFNWYDNVKQMIGIYQKVLGK